MNDHKIINVTKPFLPPIEEYISYVEEIWKTNILTNNGPLVVKLEEKLKQFLNLNNLYITNNGTIPLQIALRALEVEGEVITTPFSYVATLNSLLWDKIQPVFVDIDESTFCIDAKKIEEKITSKTTAILAVHVYGIPCDVEGIEKVANKYNLKVIYDAAHAFGVKFKNRSLLSFGDVSTVSFHATKLFHTAEGGAIVAENIELNNKIMLLRQFGHIQDEYFLPGINAKISELQAAMGLACMTHINQIISKRKLLCDYYDAELEGRILRPVISSNIEYNYSYYPVIFNSENALLQTMKLLMNSNIFPRRYFYPSLNTLPFLSKKQPCEISESISKRVLCLPLSYDLSESDIDLIVGIIKKTV